MMRSGFTRGKSGVQTVYDVFAVAPLGAGVLDAPASIAGLLPLYPQQRTKSVVPWRMALCATFCREQMQQSQSAEPYSITSLARKRIDCGIVSRSAFAVLRLMRSSNLVGCSTGRSAGLAPFNILSA
jgi:hypothetical protein